MRESVLTPRTKEMKENKVQKANSTQRSLEVRTRNFPANDNALRVPASGGQFLINAPCLGSYGATTQGHYVA